MRIRDWSSDVCSSDLLAAATGKAERGDAKQRQHDRTATGRDETRKLGHAEITLFWAHAADGPGRAGCELPASLSPLPPSGKRGNARARRRPTVVNVQQIGTQRECLFLRSANQWNNLSRDKKSVVRGK